MYIIRHVFTLKFITAIALATLFMSTTPIMEAQAFWFTRVHCPCNYLSALYFSKKAVRKIGGSFAIEECINEPEVIKATGPIESNFCSIEIEADLPEEDSEEVIDCAYEFICGEEEGESEPETDFFILKFDVHDITEQEFEACRDQIKFISHFIFGVRCASNP